MTHHTVDGYCNRNTFSGQSCSIFCSISHFLPVSLLAFYNLLLKQARVNAWRVKPLFSQSTGFFLHTLCDKSTAVRKNVNQCRQCIQPSERGVWRAEKGITNITCIPSFSRLLCVGANQSILINILFFSLALYCRTQ